MLGAVQRRGIRPVSVRNINGVALRHVAVRHIIAKTIQIAPPGAAVIKPHFKRFEKAVHHLLIGSQDRVIRRVMARVGGGIRIAIEDGLNAAATKLCRQIRLVDRQRRAIADCAVVHRILPGQKRGARRPARAGHGDMIGEAYRLLHEGPQMRQIGCFGKLAIETVGPKLVEHDKQDIGLCR